MEKVRDSVREDARRQHRSLAMFCSLFCWHHDKKAVFVKKEIFLSFIGLERLKEIRFKWFKEDIKPYFPHVFFHTNNDNVELIVISRLSKENTLDDKKCAILFRPAIFEIANSYTPSSKLLISLGEEENRNPSEMVEKIFPFISSIENMYEFSISNTLSMLTNGIVDPELALSINDA